MAEAPGRPDLPDIPLATTAPKSSRTLQLVWLIPIVAALVGGWIAVKSILEKGPTITIGFKTAEGLEAGKTKIRFKDVEVGIVKSVVIAKDLKSVVVTADIVKDLAPHLVEDTRFWVVRPRISGGSVSGLGTLLSGAYIGVDLGTSTKRQHEYDGLETPPVFTTDAPGREFVLRSESIGSLDNGSPIYYRRLQVGQVAGYTLNDEGKGVAIKVFVNAPYDKFVTGNTRFFQASGIDFSLDASGFKVSLQSVVSLLVGGLAFETPTDSADLPPAQAGARFTLYPNRAVALKNPEVDQKKAVMLFNESVRGLVIGAPVDFRGIEVGSVTAIRLDYDRERQRVDTVVEVDFYPSRLSSLAMTKQDQMAPSEAERRARNARLFQAGLRAQLRTGSLLTGQLYVALDFFPGAPKFKPRPPRKIGDFVFEEVPTTPSDVKELMAQIASISAKIQAFPLDEIGKDIHQTLVKVQEIQFGQVGSDASQALQSAHKLMQRLDTEVTPEARAMLEDARKALVSADRVLKPESPLAQDARDAMREIARAAAAFRALADYLERHPEALINGKKE